MQVLKIMPHRYPEVIDIGEELINLQDAVGGWIQAIYPYDDPVAIICNEEGKLNGLELNRAIRGDDGRVIDVIAGNMLITGLTDDNFGDLSPALTKKYEALFHYPESFVLHGGSIVVIKEAIFDYGRGKTE